MSTRLPQVKPQQLIRALERLGFVIRRQTGSHVIMRHPATGHITVIPNHAGDLKRSLIFGIIKQTSISREDLLREL